jgi:two-component sensor histidine kinase
MRLKKLSFYLIPCLIIIGNYKPTLTAQESSKKIKALEQFNLSNALIDSKNTSANRLIKVWDSLATTHIQYNFLPIEQWEKIFYKQYQFSLKNKNKSITIQLAKKLAFIYHSEAKFKKGLPLLEFLFKNKNDLSEKDYESLLIKLEEEYRADGNIKDAIKLRNLRIEKGYIKTFWELYKNCSLFEEALKDYQLFEPLPSEIGIPRIRYYSALADLFFSVNKLDSAINYYGISKNESRLLLKEIKQTKQYRDSSILYYKGLATGNIGKCYAAMGRYKQAIPLLKYDIGLSKNAEDNKNIKWLLLSECYFHTNEMSKCKRYLDSARSHMNEKTDNDGTLKLNLILSKYYKAKKNIDSAFYFSQIYSGYKDSLYNKTQRNQSLLLLTKLETEKRRGKLIAANFNLEKSSGEIVKSRNLLIVFSIIGIAISFITVILFKSNQAKKKTSSTIQAKNKQLEEQNIKISSQNEYTEILLSELQHRVKNNLQVISSLANLRKRRSKFEETQIELTAIQSRIQAMVLVHEQLYNNDISNSNIDFALYIKKIVPNIAYIYTNDERKIETIYNLESIIASVEKSIALGLIINEVVTNALKFAFTESTNEPGVLLISMHKKNERCCITIQDNGKGFIIRQDNNGGLGLNIIKSMCTQLKAIYSLTTTNGVKHTIDFEL